SSMMELLIYPSLIELENIKVRLSNDSLLSTIGFIIVSCLFLFLPIIVNGIICYKLLVSESVSIWFPLFYFLILIKIFLNIVFYIRQVR
ncbi:MAG: hypothetical protein ABNG98_05300, partial [Flavobacterium sp.]